MKPHPRIRKTIKWGGAAVTLLLVVVWIGSGWWYPHCYPAPWLSLTALRGGVMIYYDTAPVPDHNLVERRRQILVAVNKQWNWRPMFSAGQAKLPLWMPTGLMVIPTLLAWRLDTLARRRARLSLCAKCNYDRAGLAAGAKCPECGMLPADAKP
ncbi:MAG TPA: hypothetical protein VHC70_07780 [Phycisphaerales bacterium]|nr:hypothetical protein [Phycisphaerales bacterium]